MRGYRRSSKTFQGNQVSYPAQEAPLRKEQERPRGGQQVTVFSCSVFPLRRGKDKSLKEGHLETPQSKGFVVGFLKSFLMFIAYCWS